MPETVVNLAQWFDANEPVPETLKSKLFGVLFIHAKDIVEHYPGDLYHDALWLNSFTERFPTEFYYSVDKWGTHISETLDTVLYRKALVLHIGIVNERGVWKAIVTNITERVKDVVPYAGNQT